MKAIRLIAALGLTLLSMGLCLWAEAPLAPAGESGLFVYIPYPVSISLDGKLDDWAGVPVTTVATGPYLSKDPAEDGSFSFAVAADDENFYIRMAAVDSAIISGKHSTNYWNEDSLEFYLNLSGFFGMTKYTKEVVQYRVVPKDIGNADPASITASGTNTSAFPLRAIVFKTANGWGFEGAVKLSGKLKPSHGLEIGFQAQANGASVKDRDAKLIWSSADKTDASWQDPSLFGRGIFYKIGSADLPKPSAAKAPPEAKIKKAWTTEVTVNQAGYFTRGAKIASYSKATKDQLDWWLIDPKTMLTVAGGKTSPGVDDPLSGDTVHAVDFSSFSKEGSYVLIVDNKESSVFRIANDIMGGLAKDSLEYFYRDRSGLELLPEYAGKLWARPAGHLSDAKTPVFGKVADMVDGLGGWYDAGDYGKYVVNGGIAVWTLQDAYERNPSAFKDGDQAIPENRNGFPDILDEARWELAFMLHMQIPSGQELAGMAYHKLHDLNWSGVPSPLPENFEGERYAYEPSTAATLNLSACAAQASRLWRSLDPSFAAACLAAAKAAWKAALANPSLIAGNVPGSGGGNYDDPTVSDDFYWAAAELFATTGDKEYLDYIKASPYFAAFPGLEAKAASSMSWGDTAGLGTLSLALAKGALPQAESDRLRAQIASTADRYLKTEAANGYGVPLDKAGYVWGSSSLVLNNALILALAYDFTGKEPYRKGVVAAMDYILGRNSLNKSFVSGYGADPLSNPHHRLWANDPESGYPVPPPGLLAGGPNASIQDPAMEKEKLIDRPIAKRYLDSIESFATNEIAINWNAPLVWISSWLDQQYGTK
jgi:endoglucanase